MKLKTWHPYYIVDFKRCSTKESVEIEDCSSKELLDLCMQTIKKYREGSDGSGMTKMKIRVVDCRTNKSIHLITVPLYNKSPLQFKNMLLEQIKS